MPLGPIAASVTLTTDAPRAFVWRAFETPQRWPEVLRDVAEAWIEPDGRLTPGAVLRSRAVPGTMAVDMAYSVLEAEPPHHLVTTSRAAGFDARSDYRFVEGPRGGTQVTLAATVRAASAPMRLYIAITRQRHVELVESSLRRRLQPMLALAESLWREDAELKEHGPSPG